MVNIEKLQKIIRGVNSIPTKELVNYILKGEAPKDDIVNRLHELGNDEKIGDLLNQLLQREEELWRNAKDECSVELLRKYLNVYPEGIHCKECMQLLSESDENFWQAISGELEENKLREYLQLFPSGNHLNECRNYLDDLPWLLTRKRNTKKAYEDYVEKYPGKHDMDAKRAICDLDDEVDWKNACLTDNSEAYKHYLDKHPNGKFVNLAQNALTDKAGHDEIINNLKMDSNYYDAIFLQESVENKIIKWKDLLEVFSQSQIDAIKKYEKPEQLPYGNPPENLVKGPVEVFFWGTPSSGKTCALGAILSASKKYGRLMGKDTPGNGGDYRDQLSNIFVSDDICVFPEGTPPTSLQQMIIALRDKDKKMHTMNIVDLAGELFKSMKYKLDNPEKYKSLSEPKKQALESTLRYLEDDNKKIHFFIVAYGEEKKQWDGEKIFMADFLNRTLGYLAEHKCMNKTTNGVYVLVTKCDKIPCPVEKRAEEAEKYVKEKLPDFYQNIMMICEQSGVRDPEIIPFSVGEVFAQVLGKFEPSNTNIVLNKLLLKTPKDRGGFVKWLNS